MYKHMYSAPIHIHSRKRVDCSIQFKSEVLSQVKEFKYTLVLFTSEGRRMEHEIDGLVQHLQYCGICAGPLW